VTGFLGGKREIEVKGGRGSLPSRLREQTSALTRERKTPVSLPGGASPAQDRPGPIHMDEHGQLHSGFSRNSRTPEKEI